MVTRKKVLTILSGAVACLVLLGLSYNAGNTNLTRSIIEGSADLHTEIISNKLQVEQLTKFLDSKLGLQSNDRTLASKYPHTKFTKQSESLLIKPRRKSKSVVKPAKNGYRNVIGKGNNENDDLYDDKYATTEIPLTDQHVTEVASTEKDVQYRGHQPWLTGNQSLPYNATLVKLQQRERKDRIQQMCQAPDIKNEVKPIRAGHRSNFAKYHDILYCPILKAGSTNMLRLLCWLAGPPCSEIKDLKPHNMVPPFLERGGSKIAIGNTPTFQKYFSFALVRNPWRRLVSVYIQKFVETRQGYGFCDIKRRYPDMFNLAKENRNVTLSFKQYIDLCVIGQFDEGGIFAQNGHWRPQYQMCSFCHLDYTFIGKIETMKSDERVILNAFGFKDVDQTIADANNKLLPNEKAQKTTLLYEDLWNQIDDDDMLMDLQEIYRVDFELFDYPNHPLQN